jgi:hypothetical protein
MSGEVRVIEKYTVSMPLQKAYLVVADVSMVLMT